MIKLPQDITILGNACDEVRFSILVDRLEYWSKNQHIVTKPFVEITKEELREIYLIYSCGMDHNVTFGGAVSIIENKLSKV